jgi:chromosome transmission fidelity protein 1
LYNSLEASSLIQPLIGGLGQMEAGDASSGRDSIPFPYSAYPQQQQLMHRIFDTIVQSQSGCFESPTGTGKSLSIICAALHWQRLEENAQISKAEKECLEAEQSSSKSTSGSGDWLADMLLASSTADTNTTKKEAKTKRKALKRMDKMKARVAKTLTVDASNKAQVEEVIIGSQNTRSAWRGGLSIFTSTSASTSVMNKGKLINSTRKEEEDVHEDDEFVLDHYESDEDKKKMSSISKTAAEVEALLDDPFGLDSDNNSSEDEDDHHTYGSNQDSEQSSFQSVLKLPQVFYCSRTHSQIAQFVSEIRKTTFGSDARVITLGSRKNMCINPDVTKLNSDVKISDRCLEMQKSASGGNSKDTKTVAATSGATTSTTIVSTKKQRTKKDPQKLSSCRFKSKKLEDIFSEFAMGKVQDIEELVSLGKKLNTCPYYATRRAVKLAQVVCMPYSVLLHADTRKSMGIDLNNAVVIFDEAHNVVEAVNHIHSADMQASQLDICSKAVKAYLSRFQLALSGKNLFYVTLLGATIKKLQNVVKIFTRTRANTAAASGSVPVTATSTDSTESSSDTMELMSCNDFIFRAKLDNVNMFKLKRHITETNLINKIGGYSESIAKKANAIAAAENANNLQSSQKNGSNTTSCAKCISTSSDIIADATTEDYNAYTHALRGLLNLLSCLTNADADGRVVLEMQQPPIINPPMGKGSSTGDSVLTPQPSELHIKFILLNPSVYFRSIVNGARSVLLVGGTLQPFSYVTSSLFYQSRTSIKEVQLFSCGHVVDRDNIAAIAVAKGPNGHALEFTHKTRNNKVITDELFYTIYQATRSTPSNSGMVVFFTSYAYMTFLLSRWEKDGQLAELSRTKRCFSEPRTVAESEKVWEQYAAQVGGDHGGALLFCVMGGKLSEGINFSDDLARCVVVVGMPYPDGRDLVLQEKMRRADRQEEELQNMERIGYKSTGILTNTAAQQTKKIGIAGKKLYEAMCMKSVNQSIGRSIRHVNDYATILLVDRRFTQDSVVAQLPAWIGRSVTRPLHFEGVLDTLNQFYSKKKTA